MSLVSYNTPSAADRTSVAFSLGLEAPYRAARCGAETTVYFWNNKGRRGRSR
jgi:hypothetical protein